jgi:type II secretion system protein G
MGASGHVCKKCGYARQASDTAAEAECPKCGAVYAKVEQHLERLKAEAAKRLEAEMQPQQKLKAEAARHQEAGEQHRRRQTEQKHAAARATKGAHARTTAGSSALKASVVVVAIAVAAYWYWSPLLAVHQLRTAAREGDADSFNDRVDYPRLRESLKGQFSALMAEQLGGATNGGSDAARAGSALGAMLGMTLVDRMVDAMVRPEFVMKAMQEGRFALGRSGDAADAREKAKSADISTLEQALKLYRLENQFYPSTSQGLQALVTRPTVGKVPPNWRPILDRLPVDPWGRPYQYGLAENGEIEVASLGPPTGAGSGAAAAESSPASSWSTERKGVNKAIFHLKDRKDDSEKALAIVLERSGFATWKMTEVRLPLNK